MISHRTKRCIWFACVALGVVAFAAIFALTVQVARGLRYVSFRGTDNTLVGWKENLNMSFLSPSQCSELTSP